MLQSFQQSFTFKITKKEVLSKGIACIINESRQLATISTWGISHLVKFHTRDSHKGSNVPRFAQCTGSKARIPTQV